MHLEGEARLARLRSNKRAFDHLQRHKGMFVQYARSMLVLAKEYPALLNEETRVSLVTEMILNFDKDIWSLKDDSTTATELADMYARYVVGHENDKN